MNTSENLNELFMALAKAQAEMDFARATKTNPFFRSKYADFADIVNASRQALTNNGLCVVQRVIVCDNVSLLSSVLGHSSGQWIESRMKISPPKSDIQSMGSYITYLKRYSYAALVGVTTEDDDGERAMSHERSVQQAPRPKKEPEDYITVEQLEQLEIELEDHIELAEEVLKKMKLTSLAKMPKSKFLGALKRIREIKGMTPKEL